MANPSITPAGGAALNFLTWEGPLLPQALALQLEEITRPGVDGHAYIEIGARAQPTVVALGRDVTNATLSAFRASIAALPGVVCAVGLPNGDTVSSVMCLAAEIAECRRIASAVGGLAAGDWWVMVRVVLQANE